MSAEGDLEGILALIQANSEALKGLTLGNILRFVSLAAGLKNDILLAQPASHPASEAPEALPPSVEAFLGSSCNIPKEFVDGCWAILRGTIWNSDDITHTDPEALFQEHGHKSGIGTCCAPSGAS
jgi:hypothetical protein